MWSHSCWMVVLLTTVAAMPKPPDGIRVPRSAPSRLGTLDVAKYLHKYGHMSKTKMSKVGELAAFDEKNMKASIRSFQKLSGIKATGKLDEKTIQYMSLPRCGVEDTVGAITADTGGHKAHSKFVSKGKRRNGKKGRKGGKRRRGKKNRKGKKVNENRENVPRSREKRYNVQGQSWDKKVLTYQIKNYTVDMTRKQVRSAIHRAFALWAKHSQLKFKALDDNATEEADFKISFGKRYHGDYYSFDGEGGTLAHAFFPQSGEAHFDEDELFSHKGEGTNLMIVAAHEFGHSLGLGHSSVPDSLMAPFYQGYVEDFTLHPDDIAGIQRIYGQNVEKNAERKRRPTARPSTTVAPRMTKKPRDRVPNECTTDLDAMMEFGKQRYRTYAFKGPYYYLLNDDGIIKGYPRKIGHKWPGLPGNLNAAAHSDRTGYSYFFKGSMVYSYVLVKKELKMRPGFPKPAPDMGLPSHPTAALAWGGTGKIYVFKKKNYYTFDDLTGEVDGPSSNRIWAGVPENIDAAVTWSRNGKTYFMKGNVYYRFNDSTKRVDSGYPRNMNENWLGCNKRSQSASFRSKPAAKSSSQILARLLAKPGDTTGSTD